MSLIDPGNSWCTRHKNVAAPLHAHGTKEVYPRVRWSTAEAANGNKCHNWCEASDVLIQWRILLYVKSIEYSINWDPTWPIWHWIKENRWQWPYSSRHPIRVSCHLLLSEFLCKVQRATWADPRATQPNLERNGIWRTPGWTWLTSHPMNSSLFFGLQKVLFWGHMAHCFSADPFGSFSRWGTALKIS